MCYGAMQIALSRNSRLTIVSVSKKSHWMYFIGLIQAQIGHSPFTGLLQPGDININD